MAWVAAAHVLSWAVIAFFGDNLLKMEAPMLREAIDLNHQLYGGLRDSVVGDGILCVLLVGNARKRTEGVSSISSSATIGSEGEPVVVPIVGKKSLALSGPLGVAGFVAGSVAVGCCAVQPRALTPRLPF